MRIAFRLYTCAKESRRSSSVPRARVYGTDEEHMGQIDSIKVPEVAGKY